MRSAADVFFTQGQYEQAIDLWSKVITLEPLNDANFYKRFRVYLKQMKLKEALGDLNQVLVSFKRPFYSAFTYSCSQWK